MKTETTLNWVENLHFQANIDGFTLDVDSITEENENGAGPRPKPLLLASLGGCTAMDVISILKKMKSDISTFKMHVEAEIAEEHPKKFTGITLTYEIAGKDVKPENVKKAVALSIERYCGVYATLILALPIKANIRLNGELISD
ncbi:MAG: OsmC family protein [Bacteroidales bacterium]